ncbi:vesicular-fusion protein SEC17 [Cristinia sonorae]|uniref:Vesicular-fusion protein SEC17 n=1 Tax=Cristinia sonorae TaxID=1940300 RepID=A0A8K0UPG3_9AGAR|nr:vesicular-fusion protein SEC17 [Cristinia sonorae]
MSKSPAQSLLDKADKKANSSGGWFSSSTTKYEEAGDLYQQAANAFKIDKLFKEAGDAHAREAECREKCSEANEAAQAWWNAAKAYKQGYPELAVQAFSQTITHLTKQGRFRQAADREKDIGQIYQNVLVDLRKACDSYERAGDWYAQDDATATANTCYKDAADLHAVLKEYPQAITLYERVADNSLSSALTKYSVREYWLRASLCALAMGDPVTAQRNLTKYSSLDPTFSTTRESKFVHDLIDTIEKGDEQAFKAAAFSYDQVTKLDKWKTDILLVIKDKIQDEDVLR